MKTFFFLLQLCCSSIMMHETLTAGEPPKENTLPSDEERPHPNPHPQSSHSEEEITDWEARLELARVLSYMQRYGEAVKEYQKLLDAQPQSAVAKRELAAILFYEGQIDQAIELFSEIPINDRDEKSWLIIADILVKKEEYPKAEQIYALYLEKHPGDDRIRLKLASMLSWQKRYEESIAQYRILLEHRPNDIQVRRKYAQVLSWSGQDEESIKEWKKTLE